ncbi:DUF3054 domain-containing protein [Phycicoccus sp. CSK15P-2]|uniref:DUF3054 domain-containing protein n=1 Tax=Phycicoccus sp. CSK15P-2 TaxID=2807627 RepID=UPI00194EAF2F|nr:DUF3054 domain-containing protein [Phycicoccus sp. CSK15P-2]MBM6405819.1 DUF3054 domain-containing protein [Phycicoccus sp. CSK15P-2]
MSRVLPAVLDVLLVLVFAALGRRSHADGVDVAGVLRTALPFLVGTAAGWLVASMVLDSGPRSLAYGAVVVAATVLLGMVLRAVAAQGTAPSFVVVATVVLTVLLVGWRVVARLLPG